MSETAEKTTPKPGKKGSVTQAKNIKRAENVVTAYDADKDKLPATAKQDVATIKTTLAELATKEKERTRLQTEAERLTAEINAMHKTLKTHTANVGRYADNVFGVGSVESRAYRNDE